MSAPIALPPAILFDWDNTLVDTLPLIRDANNAIRAKFGLPLWDIAEAHASTQKVGRDGLKANYGDRWEEADRMFYEYVQAHHLDALVALEGAGDLLAFLHGLHVPMGLVSNKRGGILRAEVAHMGWAHYFQTVLGPDDVGYSGKPKPDGIFAALGSLDVIPEQAPHVWYVGDTENDMATAKAAGVVPVFVLRAEVSHHLENAAAQPAFSFSGCRECLDYLKGLVDSSL
ncbi:MAG: HAD family hydrolase [Alphaproteobacteria bacterium]|nr:HAD family hydrolase [Alphaproteobacteria bacterium]